MQDYGEGQGSGDAIHTEKVVTDRKIFFLDLKENDRGRFVKITEDVRGRRDTIMLPVESLSEFIEALQEISSVDAEFE
ncbi:MAG: DNA-binding protein [Verrucomicrobiales bacterium]